MDSKLQFQFVSLIKLKQQLAHAAHTKNSTNLCTSFEKMKIRKNLDLSGKKLVHPLHPTQSARTEGTHAAYVINLALTTS